ncbi:MAG: hypothetical protein IJY50_09215 [Clostridia bacterium]|nr:hypothetical protein [Clostridia bacterium]
MSHSYPASWKNCATCAYWVGKREADFFTQWSRVESISAAGKCMCRKSGFMNREKPASASCSYYLKWAVLQQ